MLIKRMCATSRHITSVASHISDQTMSMTTRQCDATDYARIVKPHGGTAATHLNGPSHALQCSAPSRATAVSTRSHCSLTHHARQWGAQSTPCFSSHALHLLALPARLACSPRVLASPARLASSSGLLASPALLACSPARLLASCARLACSSRQLVSSARLVCSPRLLASPAPWAITACEAACCAGEMAAAATGREEEGGPSGEGADGEWGAGGGGGGGQGGGGVGACQVVPRRLVSGPCRLRRSCRRRPRAYIALSRAFVCPCVRGTWHA